MDCLINCTLTLIISFQYDINGNITNKSDVGDYSYNAVNGVNSTHPHTPNSITGLKTHTNNRDRTYTYDANGSSGFCQGWGLLAYLLYLLYLLYSLCRF
jgi:hypothetical protein